jgi:hypothetical protein
MLRDPIKLGNIAKAAANPSPAPKEKSTQPPRHRSLGVPGTQLTQPNE